MSAKMAVSQPDTLVQEENYLSQNRHIWQGDTLKITARMVRVVVSAELTLGVTHR